MDKLIQPLSDVLKQYPELSAKVIAIISTIFTVFATTYVFLQEQAKSVLEERIDNHRTQAEMCEDNEKKMLGKFEKIEETMQSRIESILELERLRGELNKLKLKNSNLETEQQLAKLQEDLNQVIIATQSNVEAVKKATATQDNRKNAFRKAREGQKKGFNFINFFRKRR